MFKVSLRGYINELEKRKLLTIIDDTVDSNLEITKIMKKYSNSAILFKKVKNTKYPLIGNLLQSRSWFNLLLKSKKKEMYEKLNNASTKAKYPKETDFSTSFEVETEVDFNQLPIPKFFPKDGGRYLTSAIVIAKNPETGKVNASIHRIMILSKNEGIIRLVPRDLYQIVHSNRKNGRNTPIALIVGYHPLIALAASTPLKYGESELSVANALLEKGIKVIKTPIFGIDVPVDVEFVIEGEIIADETEEEGPFVDITGTLDTKRIQPVIRFKKLYHRKNAIFQTILPAHEEHYLLMGFPKEAAIYSYVKKIVPEVHDLVLTSGGCGWLHAVISITQRKTGDAKNVALAAFAAHPSLKWCTVVNEDIDVNNPSSVEWATITRAGLGDIIVIDNIRGSSLDPSRNKNDDTSIKVIIDATKKENRNENEYNRIISD
ncbi:MAG: UbiD family decarboxylase [Candidatus Heimdallarchaeaceae archaeon]